MRYLFCLSKNALLLDIETTGLKRETEHIISIGIIYCDEKGSPTFKHWFLENKEEEKALLESFLLFLKNIQSVYSYYGKSFDYPFLLSRMEHFKLDTSIFLKLKLIDMRDCLKHFSSNRQQLEGLLKFKRESSVTGREVIKLYHTYEASKVPVYKELILKHQADELGSLIAFYEIYYVLMHIDELTLCSQKQTSDQLVVTFKTKLPFNHSFSSEAFGWHFTAAESLLILSLPLVTTSLKQYLEPVKDYFYVESQFQLIHKSLAQFIPSDLKRKATREECSIQKESLYLKIFTSYKVTAPIWYDASKSMYIEAENFTRELLQTQLFSLFFKRSSVK